MFLALSAALFAHPVTCAATSLTDAMVLDGEPRTQWEGLSRALAHYLNFEYLDSLPVEQAVESIEAVLARGDSYVAPLSETSYCMVQGADSLRILELFALSGDELSGKNCAATVLFEKAGDKWVPTVLDSVRWGEVGIMSGQSAWIGGHLVRVGTFVTGGNAAAAGAELWSKRDGRWCLDQSVFSLGSSRGASTLRVAGGKLLEPISVISRVSPKDGSDWVYYRQSWELANGRLVELPRKRVSHPDD